MNVAKNKKIWTQACVGVFGAFLVFFTILLFKNPAPLHHVIERWKMSEAGFEFQETNTLSGYYLDACAQNKFLPVLGQGNCICMAVVPDLSQLGAHPSSGAQSWHFAASEVFIESYEVFILSHFKDYSSDRASNRMLAADLKTYLESRCSQWVVVGHGQGGGIAEWLALDWPAGVIKLVLLSPTGDLGGRLASLQAPTLVLWGKKDPIQPLADSYSVRDALPRRTLWRQLPECGHFIQEECVKDVVEAISDMVQFGTM